MVWLKSSSIIFHLCVAYTFATVIIINRPPQDQNQRPPPSQPPQSTKPPCMMMMNKENKTSSPSPNMNCTSTPPGNSTTSRPFQLPPFPAYPPPQQNRPPKIKLEFIPLGALLFGG